ncbi:hydroxymethylglutaryl-CoA lyase [Marivita sp. GX14005]|uniref:hydroxymethylglutaryl-CoA lyase n=1 Tax=Marivita sp. GX14005 TaxID=2942276 RepID=UPI002019450C|nr:hydroxymethylglutaryl-CoA lyase [Marivita sp. GX14005]MCL3883273.1 hydroxymethylglutaryl-CoA lyase [Marivita sp. GX14005]
MKIEITEVGSRDGLQNEPVPVPTETKIELIHRAVDAGARRFEVTSFVSPRAVPQMADAEAVLAGLDVPEDVVLQALVPNLRGAERAAKTRAQEWVCFLSVTESHSQANSNCSVDEAIARLEPVVELARTEGRKPVAALAASFGCPFEGITPLDQVLRVARGLHDLGFEEMKLGDTIGTAIPSQVSVTVSSLQKALPQVGLVLHLHDTRGLSLANVMAGLSLGITRYESSLGGIGGCPFAPGATGNVATEDLVHFLHAEGHETGFDLGKLVEHGRWLSEQLGRELPGRLLKAPPIGATQPLDGIERAVG